MCVARIQAQLDTEESINGANSEFETFICGEMQNHGLLKREPSERPHKSKAKAYWNEELQTRWDAVCNAERAWLRCADSTQRRHHLKEVYCTERKFFDRLHRKCKRKHQRQKQFDLLDKFNTDSREFWRDIGKIGLANDRKHSIPLEVIHDDGYMVAGLDNALREWKVQYDRLYNGSDVDAQYDEIHYTDMCNQLQIDYFQVDFDTAILNQPIQRDEVRDAVVRSKLQKAPGIDAIPAEALKTDVCVDLLYRIISVCFEKGIVPDQWKTGIVNPIVKPNSTDPRKPLTYRGITLISVPCKVYCDILNRRLSSWIEDSGIMADEQNGFRKK